MRARIFLVALLLLLGPSCGAAFAQSADAPAEEVDVKGIVFDHLGDDYFWHLFSTKHIHARIPLPVIVRGSDGGWHAFSAARLPYRGFEIASQGEHEGRIVETATGERPLDLSVTKNALGIMIICCVMALLIFSLAGWYRDGRRDAPGGLRGAVEMTVEYVCDEVIAPCVGEGWRRFAPLLLALFFFILVGNLMGLIPVFPGGANVTGNIAVTMVLAVTTMLAVNFSGTKEYWKEILWPPVPVWLKVPTPIMPLLEIVGVFTKPFALMIRLFANIVAGHAVILGLVCVIFVTARMGATVNGAMGVVAVLFGIFMLCLELLVAFLQAYVFTLLSSVFIGMARVSSHDHEKPVNH